MKRLSNISSIYSVAIQLVLAVSIGVGIGLGPLSSKVADAHTSRTELKVKNLTRWEGRNQYFYFTGSVPRGFSIPQRISEGANPWNWFAHFNGDFLWWSFRYTNDNWRNSGGAICGYSRNGVHWKPLDPSAPGRPTPAARVNKCISGSPKAGKIKNAQFTINSKFKWWTNSAPIDPNYWRAGYVDLLTVAVHEMGHASTYSDHFYDVCGGSNPASMCPTANYLYGRDLNEHDVHNFVSRYKFYWW